MPDGFDKATGEVLAISDYQTSAEINEIFAALAKAQGDIRNATKDSANPHFKSRYADLASVSDACRGPLSKNGIAVVQVPHNDGHNIAVTTILGHASGQWISGKLAVAPAKWDAQGVGSVTTYLRRYALAAMAGVAPGDDDDGEAAVGRGDGNNRAEIAAPRPNTRKVAPQIPDGAVEMRTLQLAIKSEIDTADSLKELNDDMVRRGEDFTSADPKPGSDLAKLKASSETAYQFIMERANKKRGTFVAAPPKTNHSDHKVA